MRHFNKNKNDLFRKRKAKKKRIQEKSNCFYDAELVNKNKYLDIPQKFEYEYVLIFGLLSFFLFEFELFRKLIYPHFPIIYNITDNIVIHIIKFISNLIGIIPASEGGGCISFFLSSLLWYFLPGILKIGIYIALVYILFYIYNNVIDYVKNTQKISK